MRIGKITICTSFTSTMTSRFSTQFWTFPLVELLYRQLPFQPSHINNFMTYEEISSQYSNFNYLMCFRHSHRPHLSLSDRAHPQISLLIIVQLIYLSQSAHFIQSFLASLTSLLTPFRFS